MATENQRVVAYLSHDEMAELKALSELWGLSLSKTIARAVREVGTLKPTGSATIAGGLSEHEVVTLIDNKVGTLRNEFQGSLGKFGEGMEALAVRVATGENALATAKDNLTERIEIVEEILDGKPDYSLAIAAINARLEALESKDDGLPSVVGTEPSQPIVEGQENVVEEISQSEPVEAVNLIDRFKDGEIYSQSQIAKLLKHPGKTPQSGEIKNWIINGQPCLDPTIADVLPHFTFSHSDGDNKPNYYRFSMTPAEK
jgi:hypothetical protein